MAVTKILKQKGTGTSTLQLRLTFTDIGYGIRITKVEGCNTASGAITDTSATCAIGGSTWFTNVRFPANSAWTSLWTGSLDWAYDADITFTSTNTNIKNSKFQTACTYTVNYYRGTTKYYTDTYRYGTARALVDPTAVSGFVETNWAPYSWATSNGTYKGTYSNKQSVSFTSDTNTINLYLIQYRSMNWVHGGPGATVTTTSDAQLKYYNSSNTALYASASTGPSVTNPSGFTFVGWRTDSSAGSVSLAKDTRYTGTSTTLNAIYTKTINIYGGINKAGIRTPECYYNAAGKVYSTSIPVKVSFYSNDVNNNPNFIPNWELIGIRGDNVASTGTISFGSTYTGSPITMYLVYSRSVTVKHSGNGNTGGSTADTSAQTQYYNAINTISSLSTTANGFTRTGYSFAGWKDSAGNSIANNGKFTPAVTSTNYTLTAQWSANALTFANETKSSSFSTSAQSMTVGAASNGTGTYTYALDGTPTSGLSFNTSTRVLTLSASAAVGTYTAKIKATDSGSKVTATKTVTWTVVKSNQSAPTATGATVTYPSKATATASGGGGQGTLTWTNGSSRTAIGSQTTKAYWAGNSNYNASPQSNQVTLTVNKRTVTATYPSIASGLQWDNAAHATSSGGSVTAGGTMYYYQSTSNTTPTFSTSSWTTTRPTATGIGTYYLWAYAYVSDTTNNTASTNTNTVKYIGSFTISKRTVTLTWGTTSWTYNGSARSTTCTIGNTISAQACTVSLSGNSITNAGSTTVKASLSNTTYYALPSNSSVTLTVTKAGNPMSFATTEAKNISYGATSCGITAATGAQGAVTYSLVSSAYNGSSITGVSVNSSNGTISGLPVKSVSSSAKFSIVVRATAAGNGNYNSKSIDKTVTITVVKAGNPLSFATTESTSVTYGSTSRTITAATGAQGTLSYSLVSATYGGSTVTGVSVNSSNGTITLPVKNAGANFVVTVRATAAGNGNYNSATKDKAVTISVGKAGGSATVTVSSPTYNGSAVTIGTVSNNTGTYYLGLGSSTTTAPTTWLAANTALTVSAVGTYYVWYKIDASTNYNAVGATYKGTSTVAYTKYYFDVNPDSGISTFDIAGVVSPGTKLTDYYQQNNYGTTGTLSNIVAKTGYSYTGYTLSGSLTTASGSTNATPKATLGAGNGAIALKSKINSYTVAYNANGGSSTPATQTANYNSAVTLASAISRVNTDTNVTITITYNANNGSGAPGNSTGTAVNTTPYTFNKWALNGTGGTQYAAGASYTIPASNSTMYALWNTGTTTRKSNPSITLSSTRPTRPGYNFLGWSTSSTASTASYNPGSAYTFSANTTLYAVWQPVYVYTKVSGAWKTGEVYVKYNGAWKRGKVYVKQSGTWKTL